MAVQHYFTAADLLDFPEDGNKYEVVHGELLVSPSPRMLHQRIVGRLVKLLGEYLDRELLGEVHAGGDVHWGLDSMVIPDVLVIDLASARTGDWKQIGIPLLVVEVMSPSSTREDRFTKRRLYQ
ncbi:MAG: Uma2 family endonuclease, partial [Gemmatimonadales bacterium]|nr:Uma2 family endonuclease [Gemmatimonadales bacterium]